jgi:hypothetical protein
MDFAASKQTAIWNIQDYYLIEKGCFKTGRHYAKYNNSFQVITGKLVRKKVTCSEERQDHLRNRYPIALDAMQRPKAIYGM